MLSVLCIKVGLELAVGIELSVGFEILVNFKPDRGFRVLVGLGVLVGTQTQLVELSVGIFIWFRAFNWYIHSGLEFTVNFMRESWFRACSR